MAHTVASTFNTKDFVTTEEMDNTSCVAYSRNKGARVLGWIKMNLPNKAQNHERVYGCRNGAKFSILTFYSYSPFIHSCSPFIHLKFNTCLFTFNICLFTFNICLFTFNICLFIFNICYSYSTFVYLYSIFVCSQL